MQKKVAKEALQTPKGTHDILPQEFPYWERIISIGESLAKFYGFQRIETPHFEKAELFARTLGETSDIVEKQMYSFRTRGGDALTLRPEGTASIARAYIQHGMSSWPQPVKLYSYGSMFRHENPQRGRYREFGQFGLEILGEEDVVADALVIRILYALLDELGFQNIAVQVNSIGDEESRVSYRRELLNFYRKRINSLCKDCKRRFKENPLRLLDCKELGCVEVREEAPQMLKCLSEASKRRFKTLLEFLEEGNIPYFLNPYLVRGLDYYSETVFEIFVNCEDGSSVVEDWGSEEGKEEKVKAPDAAVNRPQPIAMGGGGRYDGLVKQLGGKPTPGIGGALGIDRIVMEMKVMGLAPAQSQQARVFLVQLGPAARKKTFALLEQFRKAGVAVAESVGRDSIKSQLKIASKIDADYALILGQKEALDETVIVREMRNGTQETVFMKDVVEFIKNKLKKSR